ncbi:MAG: ABC transporter ATP-binding protein [Clostridia bacterium]|nr:ABC transporter ATP-binding protein [Clostridia bacterium]
MNDNSPILQCKHLVKSYGNAAPVLKDFNISVPAGRILGLLGPNGCGKSTFLKLVAGILTPDSGSIEICGEPRTEESNRLISYLPERTYFNSSMKVYQLIDFFADFYEDFDPSVAEKMLKDLDIPLDRRLAALSKGMKEKTQLIMVMSRRTRLYMLDEPIGGVDPASREYILNTIIGNFNPDASVIITTHLIADIEPVLDEFAFMAYGGEILRAGNAERVREVTGRSIDELFREVFRCSARY